MPARCWYCYHGQPNPLEQKLKSESKPMEKATTEKSMDDRTGSTIREHKRENKSNHAVPANSTQADSGAGLVPKVVCTTPGCQNKRHPRDLTGYCLPCKESRGMRVDRRSRYKDRPKHKHVRVPVNPPSAAPVADDPPSKSIASEKRAQNRASRRQGGPVTVDSEFLQLAWDSAPKAVRDGVVDELWPELPTAVQVQLARAAMQKASVLMSRGSATPVGCGQKQVLATHN